MLRPKVFQGGYGPEAYLAWTANIDSCIFHNRMPQRERLPLAINHLRGEAATWWDLDEEERWYYNEPAINTWEELKILMDKRYIPKDFPQEIKERYGRRPICKRAQQATSKSKMSIPLPPKEPEPPDPPRVSPCHSSPPPSIDKDKREKDVHQNSSDDIRSHEQVLRTKLSQEGGNDVVVEPKDECQKPKMMQPKPEPQQPILTSLSTSQNRGHSWSIRPNKPTNLQSFQWPDKDVCASLERFLPNHKEVSQETTWSTFLTHQVSKNSSELIQTGSDQFTNRQLTRETLNRSKGGLSIFGTLRIHVWHPGEFLIHLEDLEKSFKCTIKHGIKWITLHLDFPYMQPIRSNLVQSIYPFDLFGFGRFDMFHTIKRPPKRHYFTPKLSRYKAPSPFPHLAQNQALKTISIKPLIDLQFSLIYLYLC